MRHRRAGLKGPLFPGHDVVGGRARVVVTSPDRGRTFTTIDPEHPGQLVKVRSPRTSDVWLARLEDGSSLLAHRRFWLGPRDAPTLSGLSCPTRSIF